jgi:hypothetical protein
LYVLKFARKTCPHCGTECLESDPRCWACGSSDFNPDPPAADPETTLVGDDAPRDVTLSWDRPGTRFGWWGAAAAVGAAIAVAGGVGFWFGLRSSAVTRSAAAVQAPDAYTTRVLPNPPTRLRTPDDQPEVQIRALPPAARASHAAPSAPTPQPPIASAADPRVFAPPVNRSVGAMPLNPPPPPLGPRVTPLPAAPIKPTPPLALGPESKAAIIALRNDAPVPVELRFDGFNGAPDEQVTLAAGAAFEIQIGPGDYRMRAVARDASTDSTKAVFTSRKRYAFVIDGQRDADGGRLALKLREPEIDG